MVLAIEIIESIEVWKKYVVSDKASGLSNNGRKGVNIKKSHDLRKKESDLVKKVKDTKKDQSFLGSKKDISEKKGKKEDLEEKTEDWVKERVISLDDPAYKIIKQEARYHQEMLYSGQQNNSINVYEAYKMEVHEAESATLTQEELKMILENQKLQEEGQREGSGRHIMANTEEKFKNYKLHQDNFLWNRIMYSMMFT